MMVLTGSGDESTIIVLDDDSEIEITVIELEENKFKVVVCSSEELKVIQELVTDSSAR